MGRAHITTRFSAMTRSAHFLHASRPLACCWGTVSSSLLLNTDSAVAPLSLLIKRWSKCMWPRSGCLCYYVRYCVLETGSMSPIIEFEWDVDGMYSWYERVWRLFASSLVCFSEHFHYLPFYVWPDFWSAIGGKGQARSHRTTKPQMRSTCFK